MLNSLSTAAPSRAETARMADLPLAALSVPQDRLHSMAGMTDLHEILGALRPYVRQGAYVYVTAETPPEVDCHARIVEDEGVTLVLDQAIADEHRLTYDGVFGWITLEAHTSLQAVGITAAVSTALARVGLSCNVLAGYYHDHLLVPLDSVSEAMDVLGGLSA